MSKRGEQKALEAYPVRGEWIGNQYGYWDSDINSKARENFREGYEQAEKDLALTWKDIAKIDALILETNNEFAVDYSKEISREQFYTEVLNRFNKSKENNEKK